MCHFELILFDLDGTLLDTSTGIFNSVRFAERKMNLIKISDERLKEFVGPPPKKMYMEVYGLDETSALQAARYHREYGRTKAVYEAKPYPDMMRTLQQLKQRGFRLGVATLKSQEIAEEVLRVNGLLGLFDCVVGMDKDETRKKVDTIHIAQQQTDSKATVLVGDSAYDYEGAMAAGIDFIGALYGFGFKESEVYSFDTIKAPVELLSILA